MNSIHKTLKVGIHILGNLHVMQH